MKFYEVVVKDVSQNIGVFHSCAIIYNTGNIDIVETKFDIATNIENFSIIIESLSTNGIFNLRIKTDKKILKICGKCDKIVHTTTTLQDAEMFRDLYKACNYDMKAFVTLLTL